MNILKRLYIPALALITLVCTFRPPYWLAELFHSASIQFGVMFLITGVLFLYRGSNRRGWASIVGGVVILLSLLPYILPRAGVDERKSPIDLRIAHFNVLFQNPEHDGLLSQASDTNADVLSFQEVTQEWAKDIEAHLGDCYPYSIMYPEDGAHGLAVFSRFPMEAAIILAPGDLPHIEGQLCVQGRLVNFIAAHCKTPTKPGNFNRRNEHLLQMAQSIADTEGPAIVLGDFNTVPWSPALIRFADVSKMEDSRSGLSPTFPSWFFPARIPIDYIFHSRNLVCEGFEVLKAKGSDHMGIMGEYSFL